jgi:hypothetical protein
MSESLIREKDAKDLRPGDLILVDTNEEMADFALFLEFNVENDTIICYDFKHKKNLNIGEYKHYLYVDVKNIYNTTEYLDYVKRD